MAERFELRSVINMPEVEALAGRIKRNREDFPDRFFVETIGKKLESLNFGPRIKLIAETLKETLPEDFPTAAHLLIQSLGPELIKSELTGNEGFITLAPCEYIATYGLDHFEVSMTALYEMTKRFSSEMAIRPFLIRYPTETLQQLAIWSQDKNVHVRRLVSEGSRPRLPLACRLPQFQKDPAPIIPLLERLKNDPELYVRRSVANSLNDIAKDHPDLVVALLQEWKREESPEMEWIIGHALRSTLKTGHQGALQLMGYGSSAEVSMEDFQILTKQVSIGEVLEFRFQLRCQAKEPVALMVDYAIHFYKANQKQAPKVFKLAKKRHSSGKLLELSKTHAMQQRTTRRLYPGPHKVEIFVNGCSLGIESFELLPSL